MRNFAPALTLRAVAEMLLPHDHAEISRVEGRPKMADAVVTDVTGALDCGVGDIYQMGVSAVKFFLKFEDVVEPPPEKNAATAMMQAEKPRARCTLSLAPVSSLDCID